MSSNDYDPAVEGAETDFARKMSYSDYLQLDALLGAQHPISDAHDEMLFIIQHQTSELWMRLAIHELRAARHAIAREEVSPAMKMLARVSRIFEQLNNAWDVLRTMTPSEYTAIRPYLGHSSGFQSHQYRELEFLLGNKNEKLVSLHANQPTLHALLIGALNAPSIYDEAIMLLARAGFQIDAHRLDQDWSQNITANESVKLAWLSIYQTPEKYWSYYELAEKLVDLETAFRNWRFRHVTTVERIIGFKSGTGGTAGVSYLRKMLDVVLFPELFALRTDL